MLLKKISLILWLFLSKGQRHLYNRAKEAVEHHPSGRNTLLPAKRRPIPPYSFNRVGLSHTHIELTRGYEGINSTHKHPITVSQQCITIRVSSLIQLHTHPTESLLPVRKTNQHPHLYSESYCTPRFGPRALIHRRSTAQVRPKNTLHLLLARAQENKAHSTTHNIIKYQKL